MLGEVKDAAALRQVRDRLRAEIRILDHLGEKTAAIELNSAIEILNDRLGETTSPDEINRLLGRHAAN